MELELLAQNLANSLSDNIVAAIGQGLGFDEVYAEPQATTTSDSLNVSSMQKRPRVRADEDYDAEMAEM